MRAILICTSISGIDLEGVCSPLSPLLDRPFLHHVIESVMDLGVREIHFVLTDCSDFLETLLGTGQRWGGTFRYHDFPFGAPVYSQLGNLFSSAGKDEVIVVGHADRLPVVDRKLVEKPLRPAFLLNAESVHNPMGWALVTHEMLTQISTEADEIECFARWRELAQSTARLYRMPEPLAANSFGDILQSHNRVLNKQHAGLVLTGREVADRVWIGRNVSVHPTAKLVAPLFIGENCRIGSNTQLGPGTAIGRGSVIDRTSSITNSVVYPGSYVGEGLQVRDAIVRGRHLVNTRLGTELHDVDDILLGEVQGLPLGRWINGIRDRLLALLLVIMTSPALLFLLLWKTFRWGRNPIDTREMLVQPTVRHPERWRTFRVWRLRSADGVEPTTIRSHFMNAFLPGLWNVLMGQLALVGQAPITPDEAFLLTERERGRRLTEKAGLLHPQLLRASSGAVSSKLDKQGVLLKYLSALSADIQ